MRPAKLAATFVVATAAAASLCAYGLTHLGSGQREPAPRLSTDDTDAMRVAATGVWRTIPHMRGRAEAKDIAVTEVVTVPAKKVRMWANPVLGGSEAMASDLQRELARVDCYGGAINGAWTTSTRDAMKTFLKSVNAALPTERPDHVLLALVRGHPHKVCGVCAADQSLAPDGSCIAAVMHSRELGNQPKQSASASSGWSVTTSTTAARPLSPQDGRMALAGPRTASKANEFQAGSMLPTASRSRDMPIDSGPDWKAKLWKNQH